MEEHILRVHYPLFQEVRISLTHSKPYIVFLNLKKRFKKIKLFLN